MLFEQSVKGSRTQLPRWQKRKRISSIRFMQKIPPSNGNLRTRLDALNTVIEEHNAYTKNLSASKNPPDES